MFKERPSLFITMPWLVTMDCNGCGTCCKRSYIVFLKSDLIRIVAKHHLGSIPGKYTDYGFLVVYWDGCAFVENDRCTIYDDRPVACQQFPVIFSDDGRLCVDTECPLYGTVTAKDIAMARRLAATCKGHLVKEQNSFSIKNPGAIVDVLARRFLHDQHVFSTTPRPGDETCEWIDAKQFIDAKKRQSRLPGS